MNTALTIGATLRVFPLRKRWLVYQATDSGKVVYAQTFFFRDGADRAAKVANERRKFLTSRLPAAVVRLPWDIR